MNSRLLMKGESMAGRRHVIDARGSTYEHCVQHLVGHIATLVHVLTPQDYGVDFYCQPRMPAGPHTETVAELGSLQVKGGRAQLEYGGLNDRDQWQEYEFSWLRSLTTPLYLAQVPEDCSAVELFSLWPLWLIFWPQPLTPFKAVFTTQPAGTGPDHWVDPAPKADPDGAGHGDGMLWTVHLGPPFLRLTLGELQDKEFCRRALATLRTWILWDRRMLFQYHEFIPLLHCPTKWTTNYPRFLEERMRYFWSPEPGANLTRLRQTAAPILINLGLHLQDQNDPAAYNLVPILEWLNGSGQLDPTGQSLLEGLKRTQALGKGPLVKE
jgi:hypothetical protein